LHGREVPYSLSARLLLDKLIDRVGAIGLHHLAGA
jgi:hypothetical protein